MLRGRLLAVSSALLLLPLLSAPHPTNGFVTSLVPDQVVISEFYPRALSGDEYVSLSSMCTSAVNLKNWSVSDGEGTIRFVNDSLLAPRETITISLNGSSYQKVFGKPPSFALDSSIVHDTLSVHGTFALADAGDSMTLLRPNGVAADSAAYGETAEVPQLWQGPALPSLRQGEVAKRVTHEGVLVDTNTAVDWMPFREYRYGYTEIGTLAVHLDAGDLTAFTSPDSSLDVVLDAAVSARREIRVCSYELSSPSFAGALLEAVERGVSVRVLVDGSPAGGMSQRQSECISVLASAGVDVRVIDGNLSRKVVQHIGALHSKYMVVDSSKSIVMSENFVDSGIPEDRLFANRGWGIQIMDDNVAAYLETLFDSDARPDRPDCRDWREDRRYVPESTLPAIQVSDHTTGMLVPFSSSVEADVTIIVSPDGSIETPYLEPILSSARRLVIQQFQVDLTWEPRWVRGSRTNPLLTGIANAMGTGARVQMLLDSSWFNSDNNEAVVRYMESLSENKSLDGSFQLTDPRSPISVVHNKGAIVNDVLTLISSNNWCHASFARNRELGLLIRSEEIAAYFGEAFSLDWIPDTASPAAQAGPDIEVSPGQTIMLDASDSSDDRAIAHWSWDLDSDGDTDAVGCSVKYSSVTEGNHRVTLTVEDAWGNQDVDEVIVRVAQDAGEKAAWSSAIGGAQLASFILAGALSALAGALAARRRLRSARKINQQHPD